MYSYDRVIRIPISCMNFERHRMVYEKGGVPGTGIFSAFCTPMVMEIMAKNIFFTVIPINTVVQKGETMAIL